MNDPTDSQDLLAVNIRKVRYKRGTRPVIDVRREAGQTVSVEAICEALKLNEDLFRIAIYKCFPLHDRMQCYCVTTDSLRNVPPTAWPRRNLLHAPDSSHWKQTFIIGFNWFMGEEFMSRYAVAVLTQ